MLLMLVMPVFIIRRPSVILFFCFLLFLLFTWRWLVPLLISMHGCHCVCMCVRCQSLYQFSSISISRTLFASHCWWLFSTTKLECSRNQTLQPSSQHFRFLRSLLHAKCRKTIHANSNIHPKCAKWMRVFLFHSLLPVYLQPAPHFFSCSFSFSQLFLGCFVIGCSNCSVCGATFILTFLPWHSCCFLLSRTNAVGDENTQERCLFHRLRSFEPVHPTHKLRESRKKTNARGITEVAGTWQWKYSTFSDWCWLGNKWMRRGHQKSKK